MKARLPSTNNITFCIIAAISAASPAYAGSEEVPSEVEVVALQFGWQPGMQAVVATRAGRIRRHFLTNPKRQEVSFNYGLQVTVAGSDLNVEATDMEFDYGGGSIGSNAQALLLFAGVIPDYRISRTGELLGLNNTKGSLQQFQLALSSSYKAAEDKQLVGALTSRIAKSGALEAGASNYWNSTVASWTGQEFEVGSRYGAESMVPHPLAPGTMVRLNATFTIPRRVACIEKAVEKACVELQVSYKHNSDDLLEVARQLASELDDREEAAKLASVRITLMSEEYVVVAEPNSLIPHKVSYVKTFEGEGSAGRDGRQDYVDSVFNYRQRKE